MADLSDKDAAQTVKLVGVNASGIETNYIDATANGIKTDGSAVTQPISAVSLPLPTGAATEATQLSQNTLIGAVTETAPASDTASSGLNGRLQRIAQRLTSLLTATTDRTQKTQLTDGTNDGTVKASSIPPLKTDTAFVVTNSPFSYTNITTAVTTTIKSGSGMLHTITINTTANGTLTVYDNTAGSGTIIALIGAVNGMAPSCLIYDIQFNTGLTVVSSSANPDFTVTWK